MNGWLQILSKLKVNEKQKRWRFIFIRANILLTVCCAFLYIAGVCAVSGQKGYIIDIFFQLDSRVSSSCLLSSRCRCCLRCFVAPLLLLVKWWLGYQHDRSVCVGILGRLRSRLCGLESSLRKMSCVYACVKNIRKVPRTAWMHFERGMVSVDTA